MFEPEIHQAKKSMVGWFLCSNIFFYGSDPIQRLLIQTFFSEAANRIHVCLVSKFVFLFVLLSFFFFFKRYVGSEAGVFGRPNKGHM